MRKTLGGHADGALDAEVLVLGAVDQVSADLHKGKDSKEKKVSFGRPSPALEADAYLLQVLDVVLGGQSDSDLVALGLRSIVVLGVFAGDVTHLAAMRAFSTLQRLLKMVIRVAYIVGDSGDRFV